jgi:aryl-alcohol dehydrogenase-like predicted oxidoreductase
MRYLELKQAAHQISKIAIGTTYFGTEIDDKLSLRMLDVFAELGGTTIDTARMYGQEYPGGPSASETIIGKWLRSNGMRENMALVTKGLHPTPQGESRFTHKALLADIQRSQDELQTDYFDVWFLHRDDPSMPIQEIMEMIDPLVQSKTVGALGASNWSIERIAEANTYALDHGLSPFSISEIQWSLAESTPQRMGDETMVCMDDRSIQWYRDAQMPVLAFSSQGKGFFSKLIEHGIDGLSEKSRNRFLSQKNIARAERVKIISSEEQVSPAAVTVAYIVNESPSSVAIVGCSSVEQLKDSLSGADLVLDRNRLDFLLGR